MWFLRGAKGMKWRFRRRENLEPRTRSKAQEVEEIEEIEDRDEEGWWWEGGLTNPAQRLQLEYQSRLGVPL